MLRAPHPDAGPHAAPLGATLAEYLHLEDKFRPRLYLPQEPQEGEVSCGARDGAAHVLRCLKVWFDLPAEVMLHAINLFDRFLTKMKVRPCHVPCITVSCMNIAIEEHSAATNEPRQVSIEGLVSVSQSACTAGDVCRMSRVLADKLSLTPASRPVTALQWLRLFAHRLREIATATALPASVPWVQDSDLIHLLEIVACDASCANARPSELALVLLYHKLECQLVEWSRCEGSPPMPDDVYSLFDFAAELQRVCRMSNASLIETRSTVLGVLGRYDARAAAPHRQRLVWRLSERTLKVLRPTDRLTSLLPTIEEQMNVDSTPQKQRPRCPSDSSEGDTADWPRSPVLPVYCDN